MPVSEKDINVIAGKNIRAVREKMGLSQDAFADVCQVHRTYIALFAPEEMRITEIEFKKLAKHSRYVFCQDGSPVFHVKYGKNQANPYQRGLWVDDLSKLTILRKGNFRATNFGEYILEGAFRIHPPTDKELFPSGLFNEK